MRNLLLATLLASLTGCGWLRSMFGGSSDRIEDFDEVDLDDGDDDGPEEDEAEKPEGAPPPAPGAEPVDDEEAEKVDTGSE